MAQNQFQKWLKTYLNRRILVVFLLGFSSGLPLALIGGTLQAWFKTSGASIVAIGFLTLITQPYSYKFLWSPLLDKFTPSHMIDRRRSWMLSMQVGIIAMIIAMAFFAPENTVSIFNRDIPVLAVLGFILAIFSATQDIAIDAYRVEVLKHDERGLGSALSIEGFRLAMIVSGGFSLILAHNVGWQQTYLIMAGIMLVGVLATAIAPSVTESKEAKNRSLFAIIKESFGDFLKRDKAILILLLVVSYKLSDAFSHALSTAFLLDLDFNLTQFGLFLQKITHLSMLLMKLQLHCNLLWGLTEWRLQL